MSDIERICEINHERRKWAEEVESSCGAEIATSALPPRNDRGKRHKKRNVLRTACTACMMACGGGGAFVGMGLAMGHWPTVTIGAVVAAAFLLTGTWFERMLEERRREHA